MSLDAATLALVAGELKNTLLDAKIDKIFEPTRDEVLMTLRTRTETHRLLLSARSGSARVCLTKESFENPLTPPGFCMLLRKHLTGGRLIELRREPGDRIVYFDFRCTNEMGDLVTNTLAVELMGRYSNLVLVHRGILPEIIVQYKNNILQKACQTAGGMFIMCLHTSPAWVAGKALFPPEAFRITAGLSPPPTAGGAPTQRGPSRKTGGLSLCLVLQMGCWRFWRWRLCLIFCPCCGTGAPLLSGGARNGCCSPRAMRRCAKNTVHGRFCWA